MAQATHDNIPEHPAVARSLAEDMQAAVDRLLEALDALEAPEEDKEEDDDGGGDVQDEPYDAMDEDAPEDGGDKEPRLALPGTINGTGGTQYHGNSSDVEEDSDSGIADQDGL